MGTTALLKNGCYRDFPLHTKDPLMTLIKHNIEGLRGVCHCVCRHMQHLYVGWLSANLALPPCVPGGSELGGDDMCSVCMEHVS